MKIINSYKVLLCIDNLISTQVNYVMTNNDGVYSSEIVTPDNVNLDVFLVDLIGFVCNENDYEKQFFTDDECATYSIEVIDHKSTIERES